VNTVPSICVTALTIVPEIRDVVHGFRSDLPVSDLGTMQQFVDDALWRERMAARFVASFGSLALAISLVGLFGVTSYWVRSRRPEIGLRLSLGARRRSIVWTVLRRALLSGVAGLSCGGVASALLVTYNNKSFPSSAVQLSLGTVLLPSTLLILAVVGGACLPAARAAWVSPARALRDL